MNKTKLKPYQVWTKRVGRERWFAIVVECLGAYESCSGGGSDVAKVKTLKIRFNYKWGHATWKNGAPGGWELYKP